MVGSNSKIATGHKSRPDSLGTPERPRLICRCPSSRTQRFSLAKHNKRYWGRGRSVNQSIVLNIHFQNKIIRQAMNRRQSMRTVPGKGVGIERRENSNWKLRPPRVLARGIFPTLREIKQKYRLFWHFRERFKRAASSSSIYCLNSINMVQIITRWIA